MKQVELLPIDESGNVVLPDSRIPETMRENCVGTAAFYGVVGFHPPWIGYVAVAQGRPVGGGSFKGPPHDNRVEIAYYTLPDLEGPQPVRLLYVRDNDTRTSLYTLFARAVIKFLNKTIPALGPGRFNPETIWVNGLSLSYAAELRPEQESRARYITHQSMGDLNRLTECAAPSLLNIKPLPETYFQAAMTSSDKKLCLLQWRLRRWLGRILSILRLIKAVYTFKDGVRYAAWKIKRHTGIDIEVTPVLQRHPILFGINILWRLLKRDVLH